MVVAAVVAAREKAEKVETIATMDSTSCENAAIRNPIEMEISEFSTPVEIRGFNVSCTIGIPVLVVLDELCAAVFEFVAKLFMFMFTMD